MDLSPNRGGVFQSPTDRNNSFRSDYKNAAVSPRAGSFTGQSIGSKLNKL